MNKRRRFKKAVEKPEYDEVFLSPRFAGFCHLYFKIATSLGAFQELGRIYFDIMKDSMFEAKGDDFDSDVDTPESELLYKIINAPIPEMPKIKLPTVRLFQAWRSEFFSVKLTIFDCYDFPKITMKICFNFDLIIFPDF